MQYKHESLTYSQSNQQSWSCDSNCQERNWFSPPFLSRPIVLSVLVVKTTWAGPLDNVGTLGDAILLVFRTCVLKCRQSMQNSHVSDTCHATSGNIQTAHPPLPFNITMHSKHTALCRRHLRQGSRYLLHKLLKLAATTPSNRNLSFAVKKDTPQKESGPGCM
jgi:hypothetical protein